MTKNITKKIFKGLRQACHTSFNMKNGDFTEIKPEYLLTSLIAKELAEDNSEIVLKLEENTSEFATCCVKQFNNNFVFSKNHNVSRNGKIDIAVYKERTSNEYLNRKQALFPIEIKGINPSKAKYLKDIERNLQYFQIEDDVTGKSTVDRTYNVSIFMAKKFLYQEDVCKLKSCVKKKYDDWLIPFKEYFVQNSIEVKILVEDVFSELYSKNDKYDTSEGDSEWSYLENWHLYFGIIVEFKINRHNK